MSHNNSSSFQWASDLASQLLAIYNDECTRRHEFRPLFDGHFLANLFPGMEDMPPKYAIEAPSLFDTGLPVLTKADLQKVSDEVTKIELPDLSAVIEFFQSRSGHSQRSSTGGEKAPANKILDLHAHLKDYEKGFESETDTEEYEKVGQSPIDKRKTKVESEKEVIVAVAVSTQTTDEVKSEVVNSSTLTEVSGRNIMWNHLIKLFLSFRIIYQRRG